MALAKAGPRSADDRWPVLQRVRWRFVLLNLVGVALVPFSLPYVVSQPGSQPVGYVAFVLAFAVWTIVLYRTGGTSLLVRLMGPVLVGAIGVASGHHTWAFGTLFISLFLHSLYGSRVRVLRAACGYYLAYEAAVWITAGGVEFFASQLLSMALAIVVMALVMAEMARLLQRSDEGRTRERTLTTVARGLLRATDSATVARIAVEGAVTLVEESGMSVRQASLWRREQDAVVLAASHGTAPLFSRLLLRDLPPHLVTTYLGNQTVRVTPTDSLQAAVALGAPSPPELGHGVAIPLSDGDLPIGSLLVKADEVLSDDLVRSLERFADEVSLADRAARRNELLTGVLANSADGIVLVDHGGSLAFVSPAVAELAGREVSVGAGLDDLLRAGDDGRPVTDLADLERHAAALTVVRGDGSRIEVEVSTRSVVGEGTVVNIRDVSRQRRLQDEIRHRAYYDAVTGLANRANFLERLEQAIGATNPTASQVAVALLDLDDFKSINDARGHLAGDRVLCQVADRVGGRVRGTDTFARIGGDEFALLLDGVDEGVDVAERVAQILAPLAEPLVLDGHRVELSASCGIAVSRGNQTAEEMLGDADIAMYAAKESGKNATVVFDAALREVIEDRRMLEDDLEMGIARGELRLHYQPVLALATQNVVGAEALVRWQHPSRGLLFPDRFIPLAEESGLVGALGSWVLLTALRDLAGWLADGVAGPDFQMHVNLSAHQLGDPTLVADIRTALQVLDVDPGHLVLEITETALTVNPELAEQTLRQLSGLGITIAIDDFGTGYASFTYLRRFPVSIVKIDRSFVTDVAAGPEESALARAIVRLAQSLGMTTVAEGIEDEPSRVLLERWGCDHGQGWLWARALPADDLTLWLSRQASAPAGGFLAT
ncbi:MAG TPA: EAL domain-containing protein [Egicoccus sp.]|nr:EAL domain-containing protein [Egicoccus sp.]HSK23237.1 EAL domain-containing protein [Egicoccus sp.]